MKTEQNTKTMMNKILSAAKTRFPRLVQSADFDHGHWWITLKNGAQYSVVDAEGGESVKGFDFEQITEADDE